MVQEAPQMTLKDVGELSPPGTASQPRREVAASSWARERKWKCRGQELRQVPGITRHQEAPSMGNHSPHATIHSWKTGLLGPRGSGPGSWRPHRPASMPSSASKPAADPRPNPATSLGLSFPICYGFCGGTFAGQSTAWNQNSRLQSWLCDFGQVASPLWALVSPSGDRNGSHLT